jgi:ribonuclease-3
MKKALVKKEDLKSVEKILGHSFKDKRILERALTHPSNNAAEGFHNERMEFLGDAILGFVVCEALYGKLKSVREGELTHIKSFVVSRRTLARVAKNLHLDEFMIVGKGMAKFTSLPTSVRANLYEALLAAIYLDGGLEPARQFVLRTLKGETESVIEGKYTKNFKSLLQQHTQKEMNETPTYKVLSQEGPDHFKTFEVAVVIKGKHYEKGIGPSKKDAEQDAARKTLTRLTGSSGP